MLKFKTTSLAVFAALAAASSIASASIIKFDDILPTDSGSIYPIEDGYQGFNWENFHVLNGKNYGGNTGYENGVVSGTDVAFNGGGNPASFSSSTAFTLNDLFLTKAWTSGLTRVQGYVGGALAYTQDIYTSTTSPTLVTFNWTGLNRVTFSDGNGTYQSVIDNIRVNESVAPVPEPETYALMGMGLLGLLAARRRKAK